MKPPIIRIGSSRGVRIPKPLIEQASLIDNVEIHAEPGRIVIVAARTPRAGWAKAAQRMAARKDDSLLDPPTATRFDDAEWEWR